MKKLFLVAIIVFGLVGTGLAFTIGETFYPIGTTTDQSGFDKLDIDATKFDYNYTGMQKYPDKGFAIFNFVYTIPDKIEDDLYEIVEQKYRIRYEFEDWDECRDVNSRAICKDIVEDEVLDELKAVKIRLKNKLRGWQNPVETDFPSDYNFSDLDE